MGDESVISVERVSKRFILPHEKKNSLKSVFTGLVHGRGKAAASTQQALQDISFKIKRGEFFGIVGRNGSGKSTLLKIIAGIYQPTEGRVEVSGKLVPFIELGVGFNPELTGRQNVYLNGAILGFSTKEIDDNYEDIVKFAELEEFMDQKLKNYSSGMQVRLAFACATRAKADILLVDEVLAVGDADFQRKCFEYFQELKGSDTTVVFVTHDMNAVREYCDRAVLIEKSKIVFAGTANDAASRYSKMFIESAQQRDGDKEVLRWGDESITYTDVSLSTKTLKDGNKELVVDLTAEAHRAINDPVLGFVVKNAAKANIMGTNTQIEGIKVPSLESGEKLRISWTLPHIFNDGVHYFEPAIVHRGRTQVADWWEEAAKFTVFKEQKTPYIVNPPLGINIERIK